MSRSMFPFALALTLSSLAGCGGDMMPSGPMCGSPGRAGTTPCSGFTETCAAGQYCDDTLTIAECVPGCTSDANCGGNEICARPVGEPIGACQSCPVCGNGACEPGETASSCSSDCTAGPVCGDGSCSAGETCPADCGPVCGDFACNGGETPASCPVDCGGGPVCGNTFCEAGETPASCPADCSAGPVCGNGFCEGGESPSTCPGDCADTSLPQCLEHCNAYNFFECFEPGGLAACRDACNAAAMADREQFDSCASTGSVSCDANCFDFL